MSEALARRDIGAIVRIFRRWTGTSQTAVSQLVGIPQPHISDLERGSRHVTSLDLFERFADGLGIPRVLLGLADTDNETARHAEPSGVNYRLRESDHEVAASHNAWLHIRRRLNRNRAALTQTASRLYPATARLGSTGILMPEHWRLHTPVDLDAVSLKWIDHVPSPAVTGRESETRALRPLQSSGRQYSRYHRAMHDLDRPRLFENRLCYRLIDVALSQEPTEFSLALTLGNMCYFDMIDVGEALAHETALVGIAADGYPEHDIPWSKLPFRRLVDDPFALMSYPLMLSVSTLTIRQSKAGATFYLLRRNPQKVAIAGGMLSVFPTGVFQPASMIPAPNSPDFDLWRNIMREYSEEYLGNPEHDGDGPPIDYANEEPFRSLDAARRAGKIRVYCLGVGVDALNYVGDVLTAAVFDAEVFDDIFDGMVRQNDEGEVEGGTDRQAFTFDEPTIQRILATEPIAPSGAACLHVAWQHSLEII